MDDFELRNITTRMDLIINLLEKIISNIEIPAEIDMVSVEAAALLSIEATKRQHKTKMAMAEGAKQ